MPDPNLTPLPPELNLAPELSSALDAFYRAPEPDPAFTARLEARLSQPAEDVSQAHSPIYPRRSIMRTLRTRPILAVALAIAALLLLSAFAYAVIRIAGFIPGIGFVKDVHSVLATPIVVQREIASTPTAEMPTPLALAGPATASPSAGSASTAESTSPMQPVQERNGITITIEQVVSETTRLAIAYKVTGLPANLFGPDHAQALGEYVDAHPDEPMPEQVRLPDGTILKHAEGGSCTGAGDLSSSWLSCESIYAPLPAGVDRFTLEIQRLTDTLPGELPENWVIPITLTPALAQAGTGVQEPGLSSSQLNGIRLLLLKTSQTSSQTAFQLGLEWEGANRMVHHTAPITLQDSDGRYYILSGGPDSGRYAIDQPNTTRLSSLVTGPIQTGQPMTFRLSWVVLSLFGQANLTFDPGQNPRSGQEWGIDQSVSVNGLDLRFTKARLRAAADGTYLLEFDLEAPDGVVGVNLNPQDESFGSETGFDRQRGTLVSRVILSAPPSGPLDLVVSEVLYKVQGPWEISWQPQPLDSANAPTPTPAPTRLAPPDPTPLPGQPLLTELQNLLARAYPAELFTSGWVHQVTEQETLPDVGVLDSGDLPAQPAQTRVDTWMLLDESGYVRTSIVLRKSPDGQVQSTDIDSGIDHFSLPEGRGGIGSDIYLAKPAYDLNLVSIINGYLSKGGTLVKQDAAAAANAATGGQPCTFYTASLPYDPPQEMVGEPAPVKTMTYAACLDPSTGKPLQLQGGMVYSDGSSRVKYTTRFIALEKVTALPEDIQGILDSVERGE